MNFNIKQMISSMTGKGATSVKINAIYKLAMLQDKFVEYDLKSTYAKILTDTLDRSRGLKQEHQNTLWDNCLQSEANKGLVSLLAEAMTNQADLCLVFKAGVLRKADDSEQEQIKSEYKKAGKSSIGIFVSFQNFDRSTMMRIYSNFEFCTLSSLNKSLNLSMAIQLKFAKLRESVGNADASAVMGQAQEIAEALRSGNEVMIDKEDDIALTSPDTSTAEKSLSFIDKKKGWILGLPFAYITGEQTGGIGASGENDMRAVERGLKQYFNSIIKPVCDALFNVKLTFASQDFRNLDALMNALKTFDLTTNDYISAEAKRSIIQTLANLDADEEVKNLKEELDPKTDVDVNDNANAGGGGF